MAMSSRDRNALVALGVIALAALAFFLFFGGGDTDEQDAAPTPSVPPPPVIEPTPEAPRPRFRFFSGRDPFLPLVVEQGAGAQGTTPAQTGTDGVEEPPPDAEQGAGDGAGTDIGGHSVTLIDISGGTVQVEVDGQTHTVSEGERFAGNFRLTDIQGSCASFTHGDEPFTLCEGGERK